MCSQSWSQEKRVRPRPDPKVATKHMCNDGFPQNVMLQPFKVP